MKTKLSIFLAIIMMTTALLPSTVFAAERSMPEGIPEWAEVHVIEVEVPPMEETTNTYLWANPDKTLENGGYAIFGPFATTESYAAFETKGVVVSGTATGTYLTDFRDDGVSIRSVNQFPNGTNIKKDNIPLDAQSSYTILVANYSGATIYVQIIYYTW